MAKKIITINRLYGSNGRKIGEELAKELGIHYYDKELIHLASEKKGIPYEELLKVDEKRASQWYYPMDEVMDASPQYHFYPINDVLFDTESEIIKSIAANEHCVIIGRCANQILKEKCLSVFIHASLDYRIKTVTERLGRTEKSAESMIKKTDKTRRTYYEYFTEKKWLDMSQYDLCIDSSRLSSKQIISMLKTLYKELDA